MMSAGGRAKAAAANEEVLARKAGMPLEYSDLHLSHFPDAQNAAGLYRSLGKQLKTDYSKPLKLITTALARKATDAEIQAGRDALDDLKPLYGSITELDARTGCDFNRDWSKGPALLFPEFADMKALVKYLTFRADAVDLKSDPAGALKSMDYSNRIALDSGSDPVLIGMLVQIACRMISDREFEHLISHHTRDGKFLAEVGAMIDRQSRLPDPRKYLGGEIVFERQTLKMLSNLRDLQTDQGVYSDQPSQPSAFQRSFLQSPIVQGNLEAKLLSAWRKGWSQFPQDPSDWATFHVALKQMDDAVQNDHSLANIGNQILFPVLSQSADAVGNLQAHDRLLQTSIALLKLRLETGKLPAALPSSLGDIRLDPFDGNPLRYKKQGGGFLLYSIGRDRVDNGGHKRTADDTTNEGTDEVIEFK